MSILRRHKDGLLAAGALVGLYCILFLLGITCPIKYLTGVSCPGCGMTRAWVSLFRLDLAGAFAYHPLFWAVPIAAVGFCLRRRYPRVGKALMALLVTALLAVYIVRMLDENCAVVVFQPRNSLVYRIVCRLL